MKNTEKKIHKVHKVCSLNVIWPIPVISEILGNENNELIHLKINLFIFCAIEAAEPFADLMIIDYN